MSLASSKHLLYLSQSPKSVQYPPGMSYTSM